MKIKKITKFPIRVRRADVKDIPYIEIIARQYPKELGFVRRVALEDSIKRKTLLVADYWDQRCVGFVNYRARKDGWNTIYEIGTHRDYHGRGVGRFLVDAVPCPTRLKCTVDNSANEFYKKSHFTLVDTEVGRKRQLNVWERRVLFISCKGGSRVNEQICREVYATYGTRHDHRPYIQPYFVDINWEKYDWLEYLIKVRSWKPVFAMVPDFTDISHRSFLYQAIRDLRDAGVLHIGVCPKFDGAIQYIPSWCRVCVSIPTRYAGFLPDSEELKGRKIHLLGGSPAKQFLYLTQNPDLNVVSVDANAHTKAASFGAVYKFGETMQRHGNYNMRYYDAIKFSTEQIYKMLDRKG